MITITLTQGDETILLQLERVLRGKSAYEVAVDAGFVGTETQWLASILNPTALGLAMTSWFATLPTALPVTAGVLWNNGGILASS